MVDNNEIKEFVENVISKAFDKVQRAYDNHKEYDAKKDSVSVSYEDTAIVFPMYGEHINLNDKTRISEQELRFAFVEAFNEENKDKKYYYSVETPTNSKYLFKGKNTPRIIPRNKKGGKSGQFDLVIHDSNMNRRCLIEFKAGSPSEKGIKKDFLKLANKNENKDGTDVQHYFIHMVTEYNVSKIEGVLQAAAGVLKHAKETQKEIESVNYILYSLNENDNTQIAKDFSSNGEIGAIVKKKGIFLHWYDEQTKEICSHTLFNIGTKY